MSQRESIVAPPVGFSPDILRQALRTGDGRRRGDSRQARSRAPLARLPAGARPSAHRRRPRRRQDHARAGAGPLGLLPLPPPAVHQRHAAQRRPRRHHLQRPRRGVRIQARPHLHQLPAGRRDQPHHAEDPVRAARSHERKPGHHRRPLAFPAAPLHGDRDAESGRASRHLSAARIAARPLPDAPAHRLSRRGQRARDPAQYSARVARRRPRPAWSPTMSCGCRTPSTASPWTSRWSITCSPSSSGRARTNRWRWASARAARRRSTAPCRRWRWSKAATTPFRTTSSGWPFPLFAHRVVVNTRTALAQRRADVGERIIEEILSQVDVPL